MTSVTQPSPFLRLPVELRLEIFSYNLTSDPNDGFSLYNTPNHPIAGLCVDDNYSSSSKLEILFVCRQFQQDLTRLAFTRTSFVIKDGFTPIPTQMSVLKPWHISSLRRIAFVAGNRQLREMVHWVRYPFNMPDLKLETLDFVFHRSGHWHYPHDQTAFLVFLLRRLEGVQTLRFIRNGANIKGFFKTWYNRLVGLILKEDHRLRYDVQGGPQLPTHWWEWNYDVEKQTFEVRANEPWPVVEEQVYIERVKPWIEELMKQMEVEEEDPDPRSRIGF
ncbi:hypothetical protein K491DRAFT_200702 [Lophiostoma macrostomum CBS 122681]|uniref:F-box domain-containing protein n=1 Tax=Lophiostoma macrostomum CBS 122681 TaxID=1314788 RepID=A0A6A6SNJ7_9PLEO|nr:hypothetical protein K491DRAFT_200702 [Lophiostoma macrostomum CBS 122681]